jgi:hypothetical protein
LVEIRPSVDDRREGPDLPRYPFVVHPGFVGELFPMPRLGDVFDDVRDNGRTMRVSYHADHGAVVVSLWNDTVCRGSFRLAADDLSRFISTLTEMSTGFGSTPTEVSTPEGPGPDSPAVARTAPDQGGPKIEQTGDMTGLANFIGLLPVPVPRVA